VLNQRKKGIAEPGEGEGGIELFSMKKRKTWAVWRVTREMKGPNLNRKKIKREK